LVIVGVGSYEIAANTGGSLNGSTASSTGSAVAPGASQLSLGPTVRYGQASSETVQTVSAATDFTTANLGAQAQAALHTAQLKGVKSAASVGAAAPSATSSAAKGTPSGQAASATGLASCLNEVVGGEPVQLVETAKFEGKPATIIITEQTATRAAEVWVVGPDCSASHPDVLAHQTLSRT
jgi:hypothetical protein